MTGRSTWRFGSVLSMLFLLSAHASAETRHELWPELDLWYALSKRTQVLFTVAGTRSRESGDRASTELALYLDHEASERISYRAGYMRAIDVEQTSSGERTTGEDRLVFDFNYRWRLGERTKLANRTRLELRDVWEDGSTRLRNRLRLEHEVRVRRRPLSPYASVEAYYDDRFDTVNRWRIETGVSFPSHRYLEWDCYFGWQHDSRPESSSTMGLGLTLNVKL